MLGDDSLEEIDENDDENGEFFEENEEEEEMDEDEDENNEDGEGDEEMDQEDDDDDEGSDNNDQMDEDEDEQSHSEVVAPVELEDFEKLLQSKELALKTIKNTQKQSNGNTNGMKSYENEEDVESIWKPVHQGFGCGIGVLLNGQLPNLELPADLDEMKGGKFKSLL